MKKKKNIVAKIMAFLALFGIIIGVVGTGALFMFTSNNNSQELTQEEFLELQNYINSLSGSTESTGTGIEVKLEETTSTGTEIAE